MTDNPYRPSGELLNDSDTLSPAAIQKANNMAPTGLTIISILCLVLGALGLLGSIMSFLGPIFVSMMESTFEQLAEQASTDRQRDALLANAQMARDNVFWGIVFGAINLVVASMLIVGSIFCLARKSPKILQLGTLLAAIFVLGRSILAFIFTQLPMMKNMKALAENNPGQEIGQWVGIVVGFVIAIAMVGFYLFCHFYLKRASITEYFSTVQPGS